MKGYGVYFKSGDGYFYSVNYQAYRNKLDAELAILRFKSEPFFKGREFMIKEIEFTEEEAKYVFKEVEE